MKITRFLAATFAVAFLLTASVFAAAKADGTWSWMQPGRDAEIKISATFATKDGVLTGSLTNPMGTVDITELVFKDDVISFSVAGRRASTKYSGKIVGDTITGTIEMPARTAGGEPRKPEWKATRAPAAK
jgi:uncharacterized protein with FMN-binding domain